MDRPYRVVVAQVGLDGHGHGADAIARDLHGSGSEVVYRGPFETADEVAEAEAFTAEAGPASITDWLTRTLDERECLHPN